MEDSDQRFFIEQPTVLDPKIFSNQRSSKQNLFPLPTIIVQVSVAKNDFIPKKFLFYCNTPMNLMIISTINLWIVNGLVSESCEGRIIPAICIYTHYIVIKLRSPSLLRRIPIKCVEIK